MSKIKKLPSSVINKIAAGEVIERPAYAVKELIENSIDAGAKKIVIELKKYGLVEIAVIDDGEGIEKQDLENALLAHTTSKIHTESDLDRINSLGFRGEALASIASISQLEIRSRVPEATNGYLYNESLSVVGMPPGTQVRVKNIFSPTPVRKKFLKSVLTEYRQILSLIQSIALSYPHIQFELINDGKSIFKYPTSDLLNRVMYIYGADVSRFMIPFVYKESYMSLHGLISHPQLTFKNKQKMHLYVQHRRVFNSSLQHAVCAGYKNLLMGNTYPLAVIHIDIQPDLIDVNVHPRKEIIKFIDENRVLYSLKEAVYDTLEKQNLTFANVSFKEKLTKTDLAKKLRREVEKSDEANIGKITKQSDFMQVHNTYLIAETKEGILLLDQHAVHEAILFNKYKQAYIDQREQAVSVSLAKPCVVTLNPLQLTLYKEHEETLISLGFQLEEFGRDTYRLLAVPLVATDIDPIENLLSSLEELDNHIVSDVDDTIHEMLSYLSCRSAIKAGTPLTKKHIKDLITHLDLIDLGYTCPHGRPVKIEFTLKELEKIFKRSV